MADWMERAWFEFLAECEKAGKPITEPLTLADAQGIFESGLLVGYDAGQ